MPIQQFTISTANLDQLAPIVSLNYQVFHGMYEQEPYSLEHYQEKLKNLAPQIFIAEIDGKIVGDSVAFEQNGSWYIWVMAVAAAYRHQGIATQLFEHNERFARTHRYPSITVKVYNVSRSMLRILLARGYHITTVEKSATDLKHNAVHLELKI